MTEQTEQQQTGTEPERVLARLERQQREHLEHTSRIDRAWTSPEAVAMRQLVQADGNVDWSQFVTHCGGILKVVALAGEDGKPDTDRVIPLIDELFAKYATTEYAGGMTMTRRPQNRPYRPRSTPRPHAFPGDGERVAEPEAPSRPVSRAQ